MASDFRCDCFITSALDVVGDRWSLVIVKHMLLGHKKTFKELFEADETMASNILSARLKMLENFKIVSKHSIPENKKTKIYLLTDKGLGLAPLIAEFAMWSHNHIMEFHPTLKPNEHIESLLEDKKAYLKGIVASYKNFMTSFA